MSGVKYRSIASIGTDYWDIHFIQKDVIEDVFMEDIRLYPSNQCPAYQGVYFKSWLG